MRRTEAAAKSDDVLLIRPGTDTALALSMMHVICADSATTRPSLQAHARLRRTRGASAGVFSGMGGGDHRHRRRAHRGAGTALRRYAAGDDRAGRQLDAQGRQRLAGGTRDRLPAGADRQRRHSGGGFGPRHGSAAHGRGLGDITGTDRRAPGTVIPNQMAAIAGALRDGRIHTLLLTGTNMLSSFADAAAVAEAWRGPGSS